ncbi:MAG: 3',5'-cyclic-nucleotide phosphodiesterase [Betaproteobacteria bacterium]|nr:3',5'-cyclic-nucleotide phosphodiesterase [Betaproteobacteria bacterium]
MRLRILGCSGGIGGRHLRTTSMLIDEDILIDAGTGVGDLSLSEMSLIDHVFVTHSHLDHIATIPFMVDTVGGMRSRPLTVHAIPEVLEVLRKHIFNWIVWPDFTKVPTEEKPFMRYEEIQVGETIRFGKRALTVLPAVHTVPAVGYQMESGNGSLIFTGDTTTNDALWEIANKIDNLKYLIIETAFCNKDIALAKLSKHLCPSMLAEELAKLERVPEVYVTHLKPGEIELTMQEIEDCAGQYRPRMLQNKQVFDF